MLFRVVVFMVLSVWALQSQAELKVRASVRPLALIAQELTQDLPISVSTMLPAGATPHDYALKPSDMMAVKQADLVLWLGPNTEGYLTAAIKGNDQNVAWEKLNGLQRLPLRDGLHTGGSVPNHSEHDHGVNGHDHGSMINDPHIWFSTQNAKVLAQELVTRLVAIAPQLKTELNQNLANFQQRLDLERAAFRKQLGDNIAPFLLSHDAFQYLEHDLGIESIGSVLVDPEVKPGAKHLMALKEKVKSVNVQCVLTDPTVSADILNKIDREPPMHRAKVDPLGWDFSGSLYTSWLKNIHNQVAECLEIKIAKNGIVGTASLLSGIAGILKVL